MKTTQRKTEKFSQSITAKALMVAALTLLLLIPKGMIMGLIREREQVSHDAIERINDKWSHSQTIVGPVLTIPYTITYLDNDKKEVTKHHKLNVTPENLDINTQLYPEERNYSIYKTILYKSEINLSGNFTGIDKEKYPDYVFDWKNAYITLGISDLRGVTNNLKFVVNGNAYTAETGGEDSTFDKKLIMKINNATSLEEGQNLIFTSKLNLNGSSNINFIPVGKTTKVDVTGKWKSPGFIGNFSPERTITNEGFDASWGVLHFNRNIPETWVDNNVNSFWDSSFGVNLVDTVDHYQQNTRSAKYALMFIALTFVVFFFVEILTGKNIHIIQYLLVGIALILFYTLLLSISEQTGFGIAYLIASVATIGLITAYTSSIFKNKTQTILLALLLCVLYTFLYVILQLEDIALLIGSIGLFIILGVIMYFSRKVNWNKGKNVEVVTEEEIIESEIIESEIIEEEDDDIYPPEIPRNK